MDTPILQQFLKSLCDELCWTYAIFWKLRQKNGMFLSWEDWYCKYPKPRVATGNLSCEPLSNDTSKLLPFGEDGSSVFYGSAAQQTIAFAVAKTSCLEYNPGEGVIGKVVCTNKHCWVSVDDGLVGQCNSQTPFDLPNEWFPQIFAGVKTILLLPLLPHGVLQLGSVEKVVENMEVVNQIKYLFNLTEDGFGHVLPSISNNKLTPPSSPSMSFLLDSMNDSLAIATHFKNIQSEETQKSVTTNGSILSTHPIISMPENLQNAGYRDTLVLPRSVSEISTSPGQHVEETSTDIVENDDVGFSSVIEELTISEKMSLSFLDTWSANDIFQLPLKNKDVAAHKTPSSSFNFPVDCELHKALGPSFHGQACDTKSDLSIFFDYTFGKSRVTSEQEYFYNVNQSGENHCKDDAESLLEAVINNRYSATDVSSPSDSNSDTNKSPSILSSHDASSKAHGEERLLSKNVSSVVTNCRNDVAFPSLKSTTSSLMKSELWDEEDATAQSRKEEKLISGYPRRGRSEENKKPRPRDRQLIQERLRELRLLVPSGAKCSIDSLLDRTIKHMLYLRRVTGQAEKLTKLGCPKDETTAEGKHDGETAILSNRWPGKTSWAIENGGELQTCPIAVEDLNQPGHMLIKMLCNEQALFLEIAQVITRLELTILKGLLESRANDTWACFIVEATEDFQKMDIFWPLMQLMHCTKTPIPSKV